MFFMKRIFLAIILIVGLFSFASAHDSYYDSRYRPEVIYLDEPSYIILGEMDSSYGNEYRRSTYDYRHGYTYRDSTEFKEDYLRSQIIKLNSENYRYDYSRDYYNSREVVEAIRLDNSYLGRTNRLEMYDKPGIADTYYTYSKVWGEYKANGCYHVPPKDQLFYIRCP